MLKKALLLLLSVAITVGSFAGCTASSGNNDKNPQTQEIKFDDEKSADLVVVGAGAAGLSAALEAVNNGAEKVIILEATNKTGGSLNFTSGSMSAAETIVQEEDGIKDTLESFVEDIMKTGSDFGGKPNREMVEIFVEEDKNAFQWLWDNGLSEYDFMKDQQGNRAVFAPEHALYSIQRTYKAQAKDKANYKSPLHEVLDNIVKSNSKIEVEYLTKATDLVANDEGQILSVCGENTQTGKVTRYNSKKGIIVATGGYSANHKLMAEYATYGGSYLSGSPATADGNGLLMMQKVGGALHDDEIMGYIPTFPMGLAGKDNPTTGIIASTYTWKTGGIVVNKEGERFVNETEANPSIREVALEEQPEAVQFDIFTDKILEDLRANNAAGMYDLRFGAEGAPGKHVLYEADSLEELAKMIEVPVDKLQATVDSYNASVEAGETDEFGRSYDENYNAFKLANNKIEGQKYYAVRLHALCIMTLGGIQTNTDLQVLDGSGTAIPGLYAAGEVVGGIWGKFVSGGTGVMGPVVFGRLAARHAMSNELATGYEVKPAENMLDADLFVKDKTSENEFDMSKELKDGKYETTVDGQEGPMTVNVTIADGKISEVVVGDNKETEAIASGAIKDIPAKIVESNSVDVEAVSGATLTSERIKKAVVQCLTEASK
ncbi:Fumarate reductase flavoprotein subunit precursor [uncultured Clostridium sp.]|uniref:FAD-binding protein n=1 Tax=uncultured Clostridium sp. TaxID=59620 RepID=UPI000821260A|nr:FAD-binding protein [uncultured Clostridium sp.]SCI97828.1 Fumarate reductase flavoprotein subunit precursor [uncultured Clostridium sp.]